MLEDISKIILMDNVYSIWRGEIPQADESMEYLSNFFLSVLKIQNTAEVHVKKYRIGPAGRGIQLTAALNIVSRHE